METEAKKLKRRILIADNDQRTVQEIAGALSSRDRFDIQTVAAGNAAREALQKTLFDVFIVAREIPEVDGLTLLHETQERSPHTVTVLISSINAKELTQIPEHAAANYYLGKPIVTSELVRIVDSMFPAGAERKHGEHPLVLKVVFGGDASVGKTTLIRRCTTGEFDPNRAMTVGVDFHLYDLEMENVPVRLSVWDLGGQERFQFIRRGFYRGARAVGLVFDASNRTSFYNLLKWERETREFLPDVPILLVANKIDLPRQVMTGESVEIAKSWNMPYYESSCATGQGVPEFFRALAYHALKYTHETQDEIS